MTLSNACLLQLSRIRYTSKLSARSVRTPYRKLTVNCWNGPSAEMCRGFLLYIFWRIFPGIFLEDFSGHFFPTKMRKNNPATKSAKKSGGPKLKIRGNPLRQKSALKPGRKDSLRKRLVQPPDACTGLLLFRSRSLVEILCGQLFPKGARYTRIHPTTLTKLL